MFYSKKLNLLFVASPKTGTVSIHDSLEKIDPNGSRRRIDLGTHSVGPQDVKGGIIGHASARNLKCAIGTEAWDDLNTVAFIREPRSKLVSAYHFNREQSLVQAFATKGTKLRFLRVVKTFATILLAKLLPFSFYIVFYKMKGNMEWCTDSKGQIIVKFIGRTEFLDLDFKNILAKIGVETDELKPVKHLNKSRHDHTSRYFSSRVNRFLFNAKYKGEVEFYKIIARKADKRFSTLQ